MKNITGTVAKTVISPFHRGEQAIQQQLGVREKMERFGNHVIRDHMPEQHREFYQQLPFIFAGHADAQGWPWASILFNEPGFIQSPDNKTLTINAHPVVGDPLATMLLPGTRLGLLGIELPTRRRNRLAAHIIETSDQQINVQVDQSFGNCPQYIQSRELERVDDKTLPMPAVKELQKLNARAGALIANSDTFFVASYVSNNTGEASEGADVSHRGGRPGFIRVDSDSTLTIPDYLGNNHFNTFGNITENARAGLLFLDFERGHLLTLTGTVDILWDSPDTEHFEGAERLWQFHIDHGRWIENGLPLRWKMDEYSPNTLLTGTWAEAEKKRQAELRREQWLPYEIKNIIEESSEIKSFYLQSENNAVPSFKPGQFLTVKLSVDGKDTIRTYTVSSAPADLILRFSVKREISLDDNVPDGLFSNFMHSKLAIGDTIYAKAPSGAFTFDAAEQRPAVLLAGGVGITPMVSMARHALIEGVRTRSARPTTLICAASSDDQRAFFKELQDIEQQSNGTVRSLWALSEVDKTMKIGLDYHHHGRISAQLLQAVLPLDDYEFYLCGPASFMQSMYDLLRGLGVNDARVFAEEFGPASLRRAADQPSKKSETLAQASEAIIAFTDSSIEQAWSEKDGSLLDFAESHGLNLEFGCRSGQCGACKAELISGAVSYLTEPSSPLKEGEVLLCCAVPAAIEGQDVVKLSIKV
ncbi:MAG: ferredoxin-NADP reductase [Pseudohongiellaceae bacterium]|jgi:ferredoxin-NADP reductase/predicted pyridoxine 5'-phosphate oxidase superfamily flavin-nucleotide-binding protein